MQMITGGQIATIVFVIETIVFISMMIGWIYGSRRMDYDTHHRMIYPAVLIHLITVSAWMIPRAMQLAEEGLFADPIANWYQIVHDALGFIAIGLGVVLAVTFLVKSGMPLNILQKAKPLMWLTLGLWLVSFILGIFAYLARF
jgi:uncharacterized membrane protein YozB (DUF420 family)